MVVTFLSNLLTITKATAKEWIAADPFRQSAVVAYYAVFSIPALMVIIIALAGLVFGREAVQGEISAQIETTIGRQAAVTVENIIARSSEQKTSILATIIGFVTLIVGSTGVFTALQTSLNQIWEVKISPQKKLWRIIKNKLFSFGLVLSMGFLMLISLILTTILQALSGWMRRIFPEVILVIFRFIDFATSFAVITLLFTLIFKILPDAKIRWRDVWVGAIVTTFLFILGKFALGFYFATASPSSAYGAAGSIVLIMLWVSYSCMILFFGAEFTKQYALFHGHQIKTTSDSEFLTGYEKEKKSKEVKSKQGVTN